MLYTYTTAKDYLQCCTWKRGVCLLLCLHCPPPSGAMHSACLRCVSSMLLAKARLAPLPGNGFCGVSPQPITLRCASRAQGSQKPVSSKILWCFRDFCGSWWEDAFYRSINTFMCILCVKNLALLCTSGRRKGEERQNQEFVSCEDLTVEVGSTRFNFSSVVWRHMSWNSTRF